MADYVSLRCWLDHSKDSSATGKTPFAESIWKEERWSSPAETKEELRAQMAMGLDRVHSASSGRHKRHQQQKAHKLSQKHASDIRTVEQVLTDTKRHMDAISLSEREQMLQDIARERQLETKLQTIADTVCRRARHALVDDKRIRQKGDEDEDMWRKRMNCILSEAAEKARSRSLAQAKALADISQECQQHRRKAPSFAAHTARATYFKFGAAGHLRPATCGSSVSERRPGSRSDKRPTTSHVPLPRVTARQGVSTVSCR